MKILKDNNISLKAKGVYLIITELKRKNESFTKQDIQSYSKDGEKAFANAWNELKNNGYLEVNKKNIDGKFIYEYILPM